MSEPISFRPGSELDSAITAELDQIEEQHGVRPDRSKIVRKRLKNAYDIVTESKSSGLEPEDAGVA